MNSDQTWSTGHQVFWAEVRVHHSSSWRKQTESIWNIVCWHWRTNSEKCTLWQSIWLLTKWSRCYKKSDFSAMYSKERQKIWFQNLHALWLSWLHLCHYYVFTQIMAICYRPNKSNIWNCTPSNAWRDWATKFTVVIISSHLLSLMIHSHVNSIHMNSSLIQAWNTVTYYAKRFEMVNGEHSDTP